MQERDLYPSVEKFLKRRFGCVRVAITRGPQYGRVDVVGLRYSKSRYGGTAELIAIEVKTDRAVFLKSVGQALGYSLMADRCYLAMYHPRRTLTESEVEMAAQLNVGLIHIGASARCNLILSSPQYRPLAQHKLALLKTLGYVECVVCRAPVERDQSTGYNLDRAVDDSAAKLRERRYICNECARALPNTGMQPAAHKTRRG